MNYDIRAETEVTVTVPHSGYVTDALFDPTGGALPASSLTTPDQAPDPPQDPVDLGIQEVLGD